LSPRALPIISGLIGINGGAKLLGYGEKQLLAWAFGASPLADAYIVATSALQAVYFFVREICTPLVVPLVSRSVARRRGRVASGLVRLALLLVGIFGGVVAGAVVLGATPLAEKLAPGFGDQAAQHLIGMLRLAAASLLLLTVTALGQAVLEGRGRFARAAAASLVYKLGLCAAITAAALASRASAWLALGPIAGGLLACGLVATSFRREGGETVADGWRFARPHRARLTRLTLPLLAGAGLSQLREVMENHYASLAVVGAVAARTYAKRLVEVPVVLIAQGAATVALTRMSGAGEDGRSAAPRVLRAFAGWLLALFVPLGALLFAGSEVVTALVFRRGHFGELAQHLTASTMRIYALALPAMSLAPLMDAWFFSRGNTLLPIAIGVAATLLELALLARWAAAFGLPGVAAAFVVARSAKVLVLLLTAGHQSRQLAPPRR
jgi:peptidoglycan biosynthesis protein MviN/MurJ (putative lipid II flippase)